MVHIVSVTPSELGFDFYHVYHCLIRSGSQNNLAGNQTQQRKCQSNQTQVSIRTTHIGLSLRPSFGSRLPSYAASARFELLLLVSLGINGSVAGPDVVLCLIACELASARTCTSISCNVA